MSVDKQLISKALELKPQDRFYLIELLVRSLDKPDPEIDEILPLHICTENLIIG